MIELTIQYVNNNGMLTFETSSNRWSNALLLSNTPDYYPCFRDRQIIVILVISIMVKEEQHLIDTLSLNLETNHYNRSGNGISVSIVLYENGTIELSYKMFVFGISDYDFTNICYCWY